MCALSRQAVTAERHARVANLGLGFHQVGPFEFLDTTASKALAEARNTTAAPVRPVTKAPSYGAIAG